MGRKTTIKTSKHAESAQNQSIIHGLFIVLFLILFSFSAHASGVSSVSPGDNIQAVIDNANPGDTIVFEDGTYNNLFLNVCQPGLKLVSRNLYGAHIKGNRNTEIGFRDCQWRHKGSGTCGARGTYIKGFLITDGKDYTPSGGNNFYSKEDTERENGATVIGMGCDWTVDSVKIERVARGINCTGNDCKIVDTIIDDIEGSGGKASPHFINAEAPMAPGAYPELKRLTISRATFTGCDKNEKNKNTAWTNCSKFMEYDDVVIENVFSDDHHGSPLWFDWRSQNYIIRFSQFSGAYLSYDGQDWMASLQLEGNKGSTGAPTQNPDNGHFCFNKMQNNEFADLFLAENSDLTVYRNQFLSQKSIVIRDNGPAGGGGRDWMVGTTIRDNNISSLPGDFHAGQVMARPSNNMIYRSGSSVNQDLELCANKVRPASYPFSDFNAANACLGAFCGKSEVQARADYDPFDDSWQTVDGGFAGVGPDDNNEDDNNNGAGNGNDGGNGNDDDSGNGNGNGNAADSSGYGFTYHPACTPDVFQYESIHGLGFLKEAPAESTVIEMVGNYDIIPAGRLCAPNLSSIDFCRAGGYSMPVDPRDPFQQGNAQWGNNPTLDKHGRNHCRTETIYNTFGAPNLVQNAGFENGYSNWNGVSTNPENPGADKSGNSFSVDTTVSKSGNASAKMTFQDPNEVCDYCIHMQDIYNLPVGKSAVFGAWVKGKDLILEDTIDHQGYQMTMVNFGNKPAGFTSRQTVGLDGWTLIEGCWPIHSSHIRLDLRTKHVYAGEVWHDDVFFHVVDSCEFKDGQQLIPDYSNLELPESGDDNGNSGNGNSGDDSGYDDGNGNGNGNGGNDDRSRSIDQSGNVINDPSFESGVFTGEWDTNNWQTSRNASFLATTEAAQLGSYALKIDSDSNSGISRFVTKTNAIPVTPGERMCASAYIKTEDMTGDARLSLVFYRDGYVFINVMEPESAKVYASNQDWTKVENCTVVPLGSEWVRVELRKQHGAGTVYFDDVYVCMNCNSTPDLVAQSPNVPVQDVPGENIPAEDTGNGNGNDAGTGNGNDNGNGDGSSDVSNLEDLLDDSASDDDSSDGNGNGDGSGADDSNSETEQVIYSQEILNALARLKENNLLANPSFEKVTKAGSGFTISPGTGMPETEKNSYQSEWDTLGSASFSTEFDMGFTGYFSLMIDNSVTSGGNALNRFTTKHKAIRVAPGDRVCASVKSLQGGQAALSSSQDQGRNISLAVVTWKNNYDLIDVRETYSAYRTQDGWIEHRICGAGKRNQDWVRVELRQRGPGIAYFDDVHIEYIPFGQDRSEPVIGGPEDPNLTQPIDDFPQRPEPVIGGPQDPDDIMEPVYDPQPNLEPVLDDEQEDLTIAQSGKSEEVQEEKSDVESPESSPAETGSQTVEVTETLQRDVSDEADDANEDASNGNNGGTFRIGSTSQTDTEGTNADFVLRNPSFEESFGLGEWGENGPYSYFVRTNQVSRTGSYALEITSNDERAANSLARWLGTEANIIQAKDKNICLSAYVQTENMTGSAYLALAHFDNGQDFVSTKESVKITTPSRSWTRVEVCDKGKGDITRIELRKEGLGSVYFDDVKVCVDCSTTEWISGPDGSIDPEIVEVETPSESESKDPDSSKRDGNVTQPVDLLGAVKKPGESKNLEKPTTQPVDPKHFEDLIAPGRSVEESKKTEQEEKISNPDQTTTQPVDLLGAVKKPEQDKSFERPTTQPVDPKKLEDLIAPVNPVPAPAPLAVPETTKETVRQPITKPITDFFNNLFGRQSSNEQAEQQPSFASATTGNTRTVTPSSEISELSQTSAGFGNGTDESTSSTSTTVGNEDSQSVAGLLANEDIVVTPSNDRIQNLSGVTSSRDRSRSSGSSFGARNNIASGQGAIAGADGYNSRTRSLDQMLQSRTALDFMIDELESADSVIDAETSIAYAQPSDSESVISNEGQSERVASIDALLEGNRNNAEVNFSETGRASDISDMPSANETLSQGVFNLQDIFEDRFCNSVFFQSGEFNFFSMDRACIN